MDYIEITKVAKKYGTPLFLYDGDKIIEQCKRLKAALFSRAKLFYAMKANPLIGICQLMYASGCGIETASKGEISTALKVGIQPSEIIFTSPGKTKDELTYAIDKEVKLINVESFEEALLVNQIASERVRIVDIALRINQNSNFSKAKIKMTGVASQFGIEETELTEEFFDRFSRLKYVKIIGVQVYSGTQILESEEILANVEYVIKMALDISERFGLPLKYLNLGGGFGIPYFKGETELDLVTLKAGMDKLNKQYGENLKNTEIIFESGRFLMAESGLYVTKILYKKISKDVIYYVCDGGSNFHSSTAFMGRYIRNNFPVFSIPDLEEKGKVSLVGPLCTPTDLMGQNVEMSTQLQPGDYIIIDKSGAYGLSYSPLLFLSHETPAEVIKIDKSYKVLRERGTVEDLWIRQKGL